MGTKTRGGLNVTYILVACKSGRGYLEYAIPNVPKTAWITDNATFYI